MFQVPRITASAAEIEAALAVADIPVLQMVLFHLTGERHWLEPPFTPVRDVSQFDASLGFLGRQLRFPVLALVLMAPVTWPNLNISR